MNRRFRTALALALAMLSVVACGQLLGLDDLHGTSLVTSQEAGSETGAPDASEGGPPECTMHWQCNQTSGSATLCTSGKCVPVDSELCLSEVLGGNGTLQSKGADALVFAAFLPLYGDTPATQLPPALAYGLAVRELNGHGGIPLKETNDGGAIGNTIYHQIAIVVCDSDPKNVKNAVSHVAEKLHVPAMIAGFDVAQSSSLISNIAKPAGVFTMNPGVTSEELRYTEDSFLWNLLGTPEDVALAYRPLLKGIEAALRSDGGALAGGPDLRVALLTTNTSLEQSVESVLKKGKLDRLDGGKADPETGLFFNGKNIAGTSDGGTFVSISVKALENKEQPDYAGIHSTLAAFDPHVVIALTRDEIVRVVAELEDPDGGAGLHPTWILGPRNSNVLVDYLATSGGGGFDGNKERRFLGVGIAGTEEPTQRDAWRVAMENEYKAAGKAAWSTENYYDAIYWLAYGAHQLAWPPTGRALGDGVRRLVDGQPINPGSTTNISNAFTTLGLSGHATYVGALGPPDIDTRFGTWNSVGGAYCYAKASGAISPKYDVLRFNRSTKKLVATTNGAPCFPFQFE